MMGLEKSLRLIQYTLLQIFTYILITQWKFNENKQESRGGKKVPYHLGWEYWVGSNKNVLFFACSLSPQNSERSAASRLFKKKPQKIICWDNQKGVFCLTYNEHCNAHSTDQ